MLRVGGAAAVAERQRSASDIALAATSVGPMLLRTRSCSAMVAANAFSATRA